MFMNLASVHFLKVNDNPVNDSPIPNLYTEEAK